MKDPPFPDNISVTEKQIEEDCHQDQHPDKLQSFQDVPERYLRKRDQNGKRRNNIKKPKDVIDDKNGRNINNHAKQLDALLGVTPTASVSQQSMNNLNGNNLMSLLLGAMK